MPGSAIVGGIIQAFGQHAQKENENAIVAQMTANEQMAAQIDKMAMEATDPQKRIELMQLAARYRSLGSKKPSKDMDLHNIFTQDALQQVQQVRQQQEQQQSQQAQQQGQAVRQAMPVVRQGVTNGPGGVGQAGPAGITPVTTGQNTPPPAPPGFVNMKSPTGEIRAIPQALVQKARMAGATPLFAGQTANPLTSSIGASGQSYLPSPMSQLPPPNPMTGGN